MRPVRLAHGAKRTEARFTKEFWRRRANGQLPTPAQVIDYQRPRASMQPKTQNHASDRAPDGAEASAPSPALRGPEAGPLPDRIAGRYVVQRELGRGGMAVVYSVVDAVSARRLALKQLAMASSNRHFGEQAAAFEREFHTLVQLSHPRIIEVYDFGVDDGGRYYTMELLEGGDLKERSPLPWREACSLLYEVCSSLALIHSRGLVHRDISPRNIRTTRDGSAKLLDFGALVPIGATGQIVGTPAFMPPEVLHRSTLDGRTDLFSLGATLYYALTGRSAFPVREFSQLQDAWRVRPVPPSALAADVPPALDALVLSLIGLDPQLRPRTAFEVMQRLAVIAGIKSSEADTVTQAYISSPVMVGRESALAALRERIALAIAGGTSGALISGSAGIGRSRVLDVCALEAKIAGAAVVRVNASGENDQSFVVAHALATQIVETLPALALSSARRERVVQTLFDSAPAGDVDERDGTPRLRNLVGRTGDRPAILAALMRWLSRVAKEHPIAILIDDAQRVDETSLALLAALILGESGRRLALLATVETSSPRVAEGLSVLKRECMQLELDALSLEDTQVLLSSIFGDVPNLALITDRLYAAAAGNPRETMELVQSLIARGFARYADGRWSLPERLEASDLPATAAEACMRTVEELSPLARLLAEVHALAIQQTLSREDYALAVSEATSAELDDAITELLTRHVLASDGRAYVLGRREWSTALISRLDTATLNQRHRMLAAVYAKDDAFALERVHHLLSGDLEQPALDLLVVVLLLTDAESDGVLTLTAMGVERIATLLDRALTSAERLQRAPREINLIRRALFAASIYTDEGNYYRTAPDWLAQLKRDSGLLDYEAINDAGSPGERLMRALTLAAERHAAAPEQDRVYDPEQAIKHLVFYAAISIAIGSRTQDCALLQSLPAVLEPFAVLSPLIHAMWQNAIATRESVKDSRPERARQLWLDVDSALSKLSATEVTYINALRGAIAYGIGLVEARLGMSSAEQRARALEDDPIQRVSGTSLRRVARLHQGDFEGAERFRRQAELLALQANQRQMFVSTLSAELVAYALASDLTGIRQLNEAIEPLAARFPGWLGYKHLGDGYFEQARGQFEAACTAFERGLAVAEPDPGHPERCFGSWPRLAGGYIEALVSLDRAAEAKAFGERALRVCRDHGIDASAVVIRRALALAEAKLGEYEKASGRLEDAVLDLKALDITGLELGATFEARARIAIWAGDEPAIERYGRLAAKVYRHGERSTLGARYERLMDEAHRLGVFVLPELTELHSNVTTSHWRAPESTRIKIKRSLAEVRTASERAERVLDLICEACGARSGHLYLYQEGCFEAVASRGQRAPEAELREVVQRYVSQQLSSDDFATTIETETTPEASTTARWRDQGGALYQLILMSTERGRDRLCAGVAVLETSGEVMTNPGARPLVTALTDELLRMGDASGVTDVDF